MHDVDVARRNASELRPCSWTILRVETDNLQTWGVREEVLLPVRDHGATQCDHERLAVVRLPTNLVQCNRHNGLACTHLVEDATSFYLGKLVDRRLLVVT